jgi:hypothetical protein
MRIYIASILISVGLIGCQTPSSTSPEANGGQFPENWRSLASNYVKLNFKDYRSIIDSSISKPVLKANVITGEIRWVICFRANAKNSYGAYTGLKDFVLYTKNGEIEFPIELPASEFSCKGAEYVPWDPLSNSQTASPGFKATTSPRVARPLQAPAR